MARVDVTNLPISVEMDRSLIYMLATLTKSTNQEVGLCIMDIANAGIQRMYNRGNDACSAHSKTVYPDTDIKLNICVSRSIDNDKLIKARREWFNECIQFFALTKVKSLKEANLDRITKSDIYSDPWYERPHNLLHHLSHHYCNKIENWRDYPSSRSDDFDFLKVSANINKDQKTVSFSKEDLDTFLIENILLKADD